MKVNVGGIYRYKVGHSGKSWRHLYNLSQRDKLKYNKVLLKSFDER